MTVESIFLIHLLCCLVMTGLIWLIQMVHYPSFTFVDEQVFHQFNLFHQKNISYIVMPLMLVELGSAFALSYFFPGLIFYLNLGMNLLIFASTAFLSVPIHNQLLQTKSTELIRRLVVTNWPRTTLWTIRSMALFYILLNSLNQVVLP